MKKKIISLSGGRAQGHYEAMRKVWRYLYDKNTPTHRKADMEKVYRHSIDLLNIYTQQYNGAMGLPFWTTVPEGTICDISFQMGFVGQQTMCAYQLMRYGYQQGDEEMVAKAGAIIDFWVKESMRDSAVPRVWYNAFPDTFKKDYPTYTRTVADGLTFASDMRTGWYETRMLTVLSIALMMKRESRYIEGNSIPPM